TDADSDTLTVTSFRVGGTEGSGTAASSMGSALQGTYGQLTLNANGSYSYVANQDAADALDADDTATDVFNYTVSDGNEGTDIATITITILGANDAPVAQNDVGVIDEGQTLSVANGANANVSGNYDADDEHTGDVIHTSLSGSKDTDVDGDDTANLVISAIRLGNSEDSGTAGTVGQALTGSFGALTLNENGSYSYVAATTTGLYSGDTRTDYFNYTVSDGSATDTATLTITILGVGTAPSNNAPVARNDVGLIVEDGTLSVANGANPTLAGNYDATGEHSGDVLTTSSGSHADTDADSDTLTVTSFRVGGTEGSGTAASSMGSALQGTYGQLTLNANGSYSYVANHNDTDALDVGDTATDVFNYTISDGNGGTDIATITITILGANDAPVAVDDTDSVNEDGTVNKTTTENGVLDDDTDTDGSPTIIVNKVRPNGGSDSNISTSTTYENGTTVTGTYGTLTIGADGSYTYTANDNDADSLDAGDTITDIFVYTITDEHGQTDTANLTITITGINDAPVARDDRGIIVEDGTLSVANDANANVSEDNWINTTGEHSGDVIHTNLNGRKDTDIDGDDTANLVVSAVRVGGTEGEGTAGTLGQALTGTYGQLTLNSNGSYSYVANQNAADALDAGDTATDVFNYTVSDGTATDTATITIVILGANDAPTAANSTVYINENNIDGTYGSRSSNNITHTFSTSDFNYVDADSHAFNKIQIKSLPGTGTLTLNGSNVSDEDVINVSDISNLVYTPAANNESDDSFTFKVHDGSEYSSTTYTMNISLNAAPVANNDTDSITASAADETGNVTTNDRDGDDVDPGDSGTSVLTINAVGAGVEASTLTNGNVGTAVQGIYGTLTLNSDGSYTYSVTNNTATNVLVASETATDTFSYKVRDDETNSGSKALDIGQIVFTVTGINDAPVAVNEEIKFNLSATSTYTVTNNSNEDALINDTDIDGDNLTITTFRTGQEEGFGTSQNAGGSLEGSFGTITLNADGSYTYVAKDNLDSEYGFISGDEINEYFNYTISDGNGGTDIGVIRIKMIYGNIITTTTTTTTTATVETVEEEQEEGKNKSKRDIRREQRQARKAEKIDTPELELPKSSERSDGEFNQGLKLVDLVAESNSEDGLSLNFKVFNDEGKEVQKYYGIMKDGSELPAWITVDSKTGKASTDIPKGIDLLEFKIIAIDTDNNEKQVTVIIDPKKISQDKDIIKQVNIKNSSNITVNNNGLVELNTTNEDGLTIKTATDAVNQNKSFKDIVSSIEANEEFKIQSESRDFNSDFIFKLENILEPNFDKIKLVLKNGSEIPSWISFNEATGKITANPPAGIEAMDFKIIIEDTDGVVTVKDLEIDFIKNDNNTLLDIEDTEINFVSLNQQLIIESDNLDNYGEKLINNL
ncbi:Ig-like domain-containing protein, partial [Candidatus Pelagibacter ubique]|nr:Ig-like domain-containing protein [Candidatus Pelagibacter ubique]